MGKIKAKPYLKEISLKIDEMQNTDEYPFNIPAIQEMDYEDTEHYYVTREFLNNYKKMTEILVSEE